MITSNKATSPWRIRSIVAVRDLEMAIAADNLARLTEVHDAAAYVAASSAATAAPRIGVAA